MSDLKPIILKAFVGSYSDDFNNQIETGIPIDINIYGSNNSVIINGSNKSISYSITVCNNTNISIGYNVLTNMNRKLELVAEDNSDISIGDNTSFVNGCRFFAGNSSKIYIGRNCMFSTDILVSCNPVIAEITSCNNSINVNDYVWVGWGHRCSRAAILTKAVLLLLRPLLKMKFLPTAL